MTLNVILSAHRFDSRLDAQKGYDILLEALMEVLEADEE